MSVTTTATTMDDDDDDDYDTTKRCYIRTYHTCTDDERGFDDVCNDLHRRRRTGKGVSIYTRHMLFTARPARPRGIFRARRLYGEENASIYLLTLLARRRAPPSRTSSSFLLFVDFGSRP